MKAFCIGLLTLLICAVFFWLGFLLFPFLIILTFLLRVIVSVVLVILAIWLLGKVVIFSWYKLNGK
ncbi:MAG: hypothetical protein JXD21_03125 [Candidatus Omnitrophica bacterium]|nr:hypothetical protein [Candidatus Omnitrophota bacterium]